MNKIQEKNFMKAKQILARGITSDNCRDWDNLFENGYNNANYIIWELFKEATINNYKKDLLRKNINFLPFILSSSKILEA